MRLQVIPVAVVATLVAVELSCHAGDLLNSSTTGKPPAGIPARALAFTTQPGSAVAGTTVPVVRVSALDSAGAPVARYSGAITITLGENPAAGTLTGTLSETAVNGVATFADLRIDKSGTGYTLRAAAPGLSDATSQPFDITAAAPPPPPPPAPERLEFTVQPTTSLAGQAITPAVRVSAIDSAGTVVTSFAGAITMAIGTNPGGGTLSGTTTVSATGGVATFANLSIDNAGTGYTLQATTSSLTSATSAAFNITAAPPPPPPPATRLSFSVQPTTTQAGQTITPAVQVSALDASGAVVTTFTGSITVAIGTNPSGGTLSGTATANAASGVATFATLSIDNSGTGYTLQAMSSGLTGTTSSAFNITAPPPPPPPPATQLRFTVQPTTTQAGQTITPAVQVAALDASGAVVTTFTGSITLAIGTNPSGGTLSGTATANAASGIATFANLSINNAGTGYTLQATSSGLTSVTSGAFNITAPPPPPPLPATQLRFTTQPTNTLPLATITPAVQVTALDASGNPVTGFTGTVTIAIGHDASLLGNAKLSGTLSVAAVNGVASFGNLSIDQIGLGYTLHATTTALTGADSAPFNIGP